MTSDPKTRSCTIPGELDLALPRVDKDRRLGVPSADAISVRGACGRVGGRT
jgi:hypothetical protein